MFKLNHVIAAVLVAAVTCGLRAQPLGTTFTVQGELGQSGSPAAGPVDLRFRLYDSLAGTGQIGSQLSATGVALAGGRFTTNLDFGAAAFAGQRRWLEIDVKPAGSGTYTTLAPRQELTAAPNATFAATAGQSINATRLNGQDASFYQSATNLTGGTLPSARLSGTYSQALSFSNASGSFSGTIAGTGTGLTGLNASNISGGTLADAQLSANVALLGTQQTFSAIKAFSATTQFTNATVPFSVTSTGRVSNLNADLLDSQSGAFYQDATNLNAGTLADVRLSTNIPRLDLSQTFSGQQTFSVQPVFSSASVPFLVSSTMLVANLNADLLDGQHGAFYQNAGNLNAGVLPNLRLSGGYTSQLSFTHPSNVLAGDGAGLTGLNAAALATGTVADTRLSSLLARTNVVQNFTVQQTFSVEPVFSDPAVPFIVNSANRVPNLNADLLDGQHGTFYQNAANLTGSLADARLSTNVALLGGAQTFTSTKTFSAAPAFTSAGTPFTVTSPSVVTNLNADLLDGLDSSAFVRSTGPASITSAASGGSTLTSVNTSPAIASVALMGRATAVGGEGTGVYGINSSSGILTPVTVTGGAGVIGYSDSALGVVGATSTGTAAVYGTVTSAAGTGAAIYGIAPTTGDAGYFRGRVRTTGGLFVNSDDTGSEGLTFGGTTSGERIGSNRSGAGVNQWGLDFSTNGQPRMAVLRDGNVGIGTNTPGMSLEVRGPGTYYGKPSLGVSDATNFLYMLADGGFHPSLVWNSTQSLRFGTEPSRGSGYVERMRITDAGRVGIATSNPSGLFQVGTQVTTPSLDIVIPGPATAGISQGGGLPIIAQTFVPVTDLDVASIEVWISNVDDFDHQSWIQIDGPGVSIMATAGVPQTGLGPVRVTHSYAVPPHLAAGQVYRWSWVCNNSIPQIWYRSDNPYPGGAGGGFGLPENSDFVCTIRATTGQQVTPIGIIVTENQRTGIRTLTPSEALTVSGNANVTGTLSKGGGSFKIDHPLDPANKYLYHSFVESPDMMNIYNGNVITDADGYATITLPDWFSALNRDYRYQLTVIDEDDTADVLLWAKVVRKVGTQAPNQFTLRSARGGLEVSWQVTGIRKDAFAEKNRIPVEVEKAAGEKGKYLHPEAFGLPSEQGIYAGRPPEARPPANAETHAPSAHEK